MGQPIAPAENIAFAFPDVCMTPAPPGPPVPVPYPNIAQLSATMPNSTTGGDPVLAGGKPVVLANSKVRSSSGNEAGTAGGGITNTLLVGECTIVSASTTVFIHGQGVVRFGDPTEQNGGNCLGQILSALPTVLVGG